ncbi:universal stress protein [Streptomyces sp. RY43-2]|uniref:Universal stress protein n=1 Tax=Streptomyces macrolidinus TaxID=2952607 RepID=A0ABT0ZF85_9ACTN|nr:universal stress protein [Streptomyces macrolidinus]MCN9242233.1 universal stress protein [Streptomyces macrolidinus]
MVRYVTAGVDESDESLAAAHFAAREAMRRGSTLRLVHAWLPQPSPALEVEPTWRALAEQTLERAVRSVRAARPELPLEEVLTGDSAVTALLAAAEDSEVLVLGSRGLGPLTGFVVGSVSQRVVARSPRPVVLVRAGETLVDEHLPAPDGISPHEIPEIPYLDVVLGLDVGQPADEPIGFAFDAARRRGTVLRVIHAHRTPAHAAVGRTGTAPEPEPLAEQEQTLVAMLRPWREKFPDVPVTETVIEGRPAVELVHASARACLVVVGRRTGEARLGAHVGSVVHALLHHAECPVAVVPHA